jgi:hypothetical protein
MVLTDAEFDIAYNKALKTFSHACKNEMLADIYRLRGKGPAGPNRIWLWVFALNTWDNTEGAINYLTEEQMLRIISKVQRYGA